MIDKNHLTNIGNLAIGRTDGKTTNQLKGNYAVTIVQLHYQMLGYTVSIPCTDTQPYDLVVEKNQKCTTVQVKSSFSTKSSGGGKKRKRTYPKSNYGIKVANNTKSSINKSIKDLIKYDVLFIVTPDGNYEITKKNLVKINKTRIHISPNSYYNKFKVA